MSYLISNFVFTLAATFLLGLLAGWMFWGRLKHKVATIDQQTFELKYDHPTKLYEYDYDGDLYYVENNIEGLSRKCPDTG